MAGFEDLEREGYLALRTRRRNGQEITNPMWFVYRDGRIYMRTDGKSAKMKRMRHTPQVQIAPCSARGTPHGPFQEGVARELPSSEASWIESALKAKYGWMKGLVGLIQVVTRPELVYFEITRA